ncbi:hypothetical protein MC885_014034 [Smutsia gigantea]|nr:hypothetical protein MC885_014034 [Smutsia gigantea]
MGTCLSPAWQVGGYNVGDTSSLVACEELCQVKSPDLRKVCVWLNGLTLRFLEWVPLCTVNRVAFSCIRVLDHIEGGTSLEAFACCFQISPSPLIYRPQAKERDNGKASPKSSPPQVQGSRLQVTWGFSTTLPS